MSVNTSRDAASGARHSTIALGDSADSRGTNPAPASTAPTTRGVITPPGRESDRREVMQFARALGGRLTSFTAEEASAQASLVQRASRTAQTEFDRGIYEGLRLAIDGLGRQLARDTTIAATAQGDGPAVQRLLAALAVARTPMRPSEISAALSLANTSVSRLLRSMSAEGLVEKRKRAIRTDARAVTYALTAAGEDLLHRHRSATTGDHTPTPEDLRRSRLRSARSILEGVQERLRRGETTARDDDALERIIATATADHDEQLAVDAMGERATAARQRSTTATDENSPALGSAFAALEASAADNTYAEARHEYELGKLLVSSARTVREAQTHFHRAHQLLSKWPAAPTNVWNDLALSECSRVSGDIFEAVEFAYRAHHTATTREDPFATAKAGIQLGLAYRTAGMAEPAETLLAGVRKMSEENAFTDLVAESCLHLGEVVRYRGDVKEASALLHAATEGFEGRSRTGRGLAFAISALGACYFDAQAGESDLERSQDALRRALEVSLRANATDAQALTMRRLGVVATNLGQDDEGRQLINEALALYEDHPAKSVIGQLECRTSLAAGRDGSPEDLKHALILLETVSGDVADRPDHSTAARVVDRWVFESLQSSATHFDDSQSMSTVKRCWSELMDLNLAGGRQIRKGRSAMGKEPILRLSIGSVPGAANASR